MDFTRYRGFPELERWRIFGRMTPFFDPSKMDPKVLAELSEVIRQLPPEQISRMQTLMHNMMAGHDVKSQMEEFERDLPPSVRSKLVGLMMTPSAAPSAPLESSASSAAFVSSEAMSMREARMTIFNAVAEGSMTPDEAERILFPSG